MNRHDTEILLAALMLSAASGHNAAAGGLALQKFLSPTIADGINDAAVFGATAQEVSIYNLANRRVYRATREGAGALVWNCRDENGSIVEAGIYIASIKQSDGSMLYQTFSVAK